MELRPYQVEAVESVFREWESGNRRTLLSMATGCHEPSQLILMADGTTKRADNVQVGDKLMGPDGHSRNVLSLHHGKSEMYKVTPVKGKSFIVTHDHILPLVQTSKSSAPIYPSQYGGTIHFTTPEQWVNRSKTFRHIHKLFRSNAIKHFSGNDGSKAIVDPYFLGVLLGDGEMTYDTINVTTADVEIRKEVMRQTEKYGLCAKETPAGKAQTIFMRCGDGQTRNPLRKDLQTIGVYGKGASEKSVPHYYKTLPITARLEVIAGLIDTDGCSNACNGFDFISKSQQLSEDLAFMCRSVGLAAYVKLSIKHAQNGFVGAYWRVSISGDCSIIPCRVKRRIASARKQKKSVLRTGIKSIESLGVDKYYGFTVNKDSLYLMGDFTVTHNCGKTICFAEIVKRVAASGGRSLILAHRGELLEQAADKIQRTSGLESALEKAESTSLNSWARVTVGSVQTLMRQDRLNAFAPDRFDAIIVDEAHHTLAEGYIRILDHFKSARVLGVTATADRADKKDLGEVYDSIAFEYGIAQAIKDGYLCPIEAEMVPLELDVSSVSVTHGDYQAGQLGDALEPYLDAIADAMVTRCQDRRTVVFLPLVRTAKAFAEKLNERGLIACEVDGQSEDREEILSDFNRGKYQVLCNSMLLTEGWDCPAVDCIVCLRPTKSRSLYVQMVGRGTRLSPETGKEKLLLLDFLWMTGRHNLVRPAALFATSDDVAKRITEMTQEAEGAVDLMGAEPIAEQDVALEREAALAAELARMRKRKAKFVDPLQYAVSICDLDLQTFEPAFEWEERPITKKQTEQLEKLGIDPEGITQGYAELVLAKARKRIDAHLATPKQVRMLERKGFQHPGLWTFEQASHMMSRLAMNRWIVPRDIDPATYDPNN